MIVQFVYNEAGTLPYDWDQPLPVVGDIVYIEDFIEDRSKFIVVGREWIVTDGVSSLVRIDVK